MNTTLNLELFKPWFIFEFKWNKHLIIKDYTTEVLVINLEWDNCESLYNACQYWIDPQFVNNDFDTNFYILNYVNILEDALSSERWHLLLIEDNDNIPMGYNN